MASFHSERESSFVNTMLSQLDETKLETLFWIAANDRNEEGKWVNEYLASYFVVYNTLYADAAVLYITPLVFTTCRHAV